MEIIIASLVIVWFSCALVVAGFSAFVYVTYLWINRNKFNERSVDFDAGN